MKFLVKFAAKAAGALLLASSVQAANLAINIDASKPGAKVNPRLYGVFLEEINHGVDGGLYAEMIQNRGFEDAKAPEGFAYAIGQRSTNPRVAADVDGGRWLNPGGYATPFYFEVDNSLPYWSLVKDSGAEGTMALDLTNPQNAANPRSCRLDITDVAQGRVGIANEGFWGVGIQTDEKYNLTFYARAGNGFTGPLTASLEGVAGLESDTAKFENLGADWKQYHSTLTATKTDGKARFVLAAGAKGTVWFDMISLFPAKTFKDRPNGLRTDIAQLIADLKPGFVRFPGGCVVEGATVEDAYNWKNTIGPVEQRPEMWNTWDYRRTHGMGFFEYLQFIEDIGAAPMFVQFAGQTCIYRPSVQGATVVPLDQMGPIVDNFLDVLEYTNGPADSKWGKLRAAAGHPAPFGLKMIEIGNENTGPVYQQRYAMIYQQLKDKYPDVQTIANQRMRNAPTEMVDEHYYESTQWFINNAHLYDTRDRNLPPVYLGEVAVTTDDAGRDRGNLRAALAEGTFLMGAERNADVVKMVSYAPLLANVDGRTALAGAPPAWHGMIYFDSLRSFGTASYYLWKEFALNRPSVNVAAEVSTGVPPVIAGGVGVGTWGTSAEYKDIKVEKDGNVLFDSNTSGGDSSRTIEGGSWTMDNNVYRQARNTTGYCYIGDESWTDYTLTLKARKISGPEGFLILFGHQGGDRYWWNLGGWGNTEHGIELNQTPVGVHANGAIETNRWYDIKVVLKGRHIQCYLDGQLIHDVEAQAPPPVLQAVAGLDEANGELIVKVINNGAQSRAATLNIAGLGVTAQEAKATLLTSSQATDNNSLDAPQKVAPAEKTVAIAGSKFDQEFPAYSLTILRLKGK